MKQPDYVPALRYHWLTRYYDAVVRITTRERTFKQALLQQAAIRPQHRVLDLACGTGTLAMWAKLESPDAIVTGVDGDAEILSTAKAKATRAKVDVHFDQALSFKLPYRDGHFDVVLSSLFFHHLSWSDKIRTAWEVARVLKPGGEVHIADWGRPTNLLMRALFINIQLLDGFDNTRDHVSGKLVNVLSEAGFSNVRERTTYSTVFGTLTLYSADKKA